MITSKADLRRWGQLVNVIEFTTSIKMCVKGNDLERVFGATFPKYIPHLKPTRAPTTNAYGPQSGGNFLIAPALVGVA